MEAILRIMYHNRIQDYDLSVRKTPVSLNAFRFFPNGAGWYCSDGMTTAALHIGDIRIIDGEKRIAALVLEKLIGEALCLPRQDSLTVGRKAGNDVVLADQLISGTHCRILRQEDGFCIQDLGSTNGTYVNDRRVTRAVLQEGDIIKLGRYRMKYANARLTVENGDRRVSFQASAASPAQEPASRPHRAPYPWFSRAPRLLRALEPLRINIESAPAIGSKPGMGMGSIMLDPAMMALSMGNQALRYGIGSRKYKKLAQRREEIYSDYIAQIEKQLKAFANSQRTHEAALHPATAECMRRVNGPQLNLWERRPGDPDFLTLRLGLGSVPAAAEINIPQQHLQLYEDPLEQIPGKLARQYATVADVPICCDLLKDGNCGIIGRRSHVIRLAHDLVAQLAALHSYDEVKLVVLFSQQERAQWEWMRWLPHCQSETGGSRYLACGPDARPVLEQLDAILQRRMNSREQWEHSGQQGSIPHYVLLVADPAALKGTAVGQVLLRNDRELGFSGIFLGSGLSDFPNSVHNVVQITETPKAIGLRLQTGCAQLEVDKWECERSIEEYDRFARAMAPIRLEASTEGSALPQSVSFLEGMGIQHPDRLELREFWDNSCNYKSMSVPIGVRANGDLFCFDIHERAHGPHGLVAGMTGSGKSEMVMSWILSMALHFSPQDISFVLIDFKGTGLLLPFTQLPHLAGTISDLDTNISRNLVALNSELERRKALFDSAGVNKIADYLALYRSGRVREPLSYLFVIIDEYAEFKAKFPDFTAEINTLFRTGRSMGVHIILLTQNPAGVVSGESENNVRFRWCLKVANAAASKEALGGHDEAAYITTPGRAYVQVGSDEVFEPIQSFYSGAAYQPEPTKRREAEPTVSLVSLSGARTVVRQTGAARRASRISEIDTLVSCIRAYTTRHHIPDARHIWQNRMPGHMYLPALLEQAAAHSPGDLLPVIGLIDDPARQVQRPLYLPLSSDGHVAVYGAPGSGKTVLLQTLAASLCMQYSPEEVNLYIMDFGGWSMGMFRGFPQVSGVANDNEEDKVTAIAQALEAALLQRKQRFSQAGVGNLRAYLQATGEKLPYLVLLVDNFAPVYHLYPQLEDFFVRLGREGGSYGVYLVATAGSTMALGYKLNQSIKTAVALQMTDSGEYSSIVGRTNGLFPERLPGRGLFREERVLEFQTALPVESRQEGAYAAALRALGEELTARWGETKASTLAVVPEIVTFGSVPSRRGGLVLGLSLKAVEPVELAPEQHHLLISGLPGSGKTTLLKVLVQQLQAREGARIALFTDAETAPAYGDGLELLDSGAAADSFLEALAAELTARQAVRKGDPNAVFPTVCLAVDGYKRFFEEISQQSVSRLRALVMMGAGLGVMLLAADNAPALATLVAYQEPLTILLAKGSAVLLGGRGLDHTAVELPLDGIQKNTPLKEFEGWYRTAEGAQRFKAMDHRQ